VGSNPAHGTARDWRRGRTMDQSFQFEEFAFRMLEKKTQASPCFLKAKKKKIEEGATEG